MTIKKIYVTPTIAVIELNTKTYLIAYSNLKTDDNDENSIDSSEDII